MPSANDTDIIKLFFQDVANQPIIRGKNDYIPLLRRIQRKTYFVEAFGNSSKISGLTLWKTTQKQLNQLNSLIAKYHIPPITKEEMRRDVDVFFRNPNLEYPPSLKRIFQILFRSVEHHDQILSSAWLCFYLVSLFPEENLSYENFSQIGEYLTTQLQDAENARRELLAGTVRFVTRLAQAHIGTGIPYLDLVQEGMLGLYRATETYKDAAGANFQQHSTFWIHQKIDRYIVDNRSLIRVPIHQAEILQIIFKEAQKHLHQRGEFSSDQQLLRLFQSAAKPEEDSEVSFEGSENSRERQLLNHYKIFFDPFFSFERDELFLENILVEEVDLEYHTAFNHFCANLIDRLKTCLSERHYQIIAYRFGLEDGEPRTLEEVGLILGVTRERVRQIEYVAKRAIHRELLGFFAQVYQKGEVYAIYRKKASSLQCRVVEMNLFHRYQNREDDHQYLLNHRLSESIPSPIMVKKPAS